jgi:hypothetical protein
MSSNTYYLRILIATKRLGEIVNDNCGLLSRIYIELEGTPCPISGTEDASIAWTGHTLNPVQRCLSGDLCVETAIDPETLYETTQTAIEQIAAKIMPNDSSWQVVFRISKTI